MLETKYAAMTTLEEQKYFYTYAKETFSGKGEIVDLGSWMGGTTIALARGLKENPKREVATSSVHAYDLFIWYKWMDGHVSEGMAYKDGESFLGEFERRVAPWRDRILVYPGDLLKIDWNGSPIEFLLVDAMKVWSLANKIVHDHYSCLIPKVSIVVQQDFMHWTTPFIQFLQYRFRDYFSPIYDIPYSGSVVFKYIKQLPEELLKMEYKKEMFDDKEVDAAFDYAFSITDPWKHLVLKCCKIYHYADMGDFDKVDFWIKNYIDKREQNYPVSNLKVHLSGLNPKYAGWAVTTIK